MGAEKESQRQMSVTTEAKAVDVASETTIRMSFAAAMNLVFQSIEIGNRENALAIAAKLTEQVNAYLENHDALCDEVERLRKASIVVIEVCPRADGKYWHAQIKGKPDFWGAGKSIDEAVGAVIRNHDNLLGIQCEFPANTVR